MEEPSKKGVTQLLRAWGAGDPQALAQLEPLVHSELRRAAHRYMRQESSGHTLQTTALINEAFVRLIDGASVDWKDRAHFIAVSAQTMRRILVDAARARTRLGISAAAESLALAWTRPWMPNPPGRTNSCVWTKPSMS